MGNPMNGWWKILARMAIPFIRSAGVAMENQDADNVGQDDLIGISLVYAADLLDAITSGKTPPTAPAQLQPGASVPLK